MRFCFLFLLISCQLHARTLQIMSYNVENLFDASHDIINHKDKLDWTFLPKNTAGKKLACLKEKNKFRKKECLALDWTNEKVALKISKIKEVVIKDRALPDFLGLVEVENRNVVGLLAKQLGYQHFELTEGPDERGVDVALLYKNSADIKMKSRAEHLVAVDYPTRNILEVEFIIAHKFPLTIFINHWPSLANPDSWRVQAAKVLANRTQEILKINPHMSILAMGDFNTIDENNPNPFNSVLYKNDLFKDVGQSFFEDKHIDGNLKKNMAPGTYYYPPKNQWNFLDHFFINKELQNGSGLEVLLSSFEVYSPVFISTILKKKVYEGEQHNYKNLMVPKRFNPKGRTKESIGYSDHYPILVKFEYPAK